MPSSFQIQGLRADICSATDKFSSLFYVPSDIYMYFRCKLRLVLKMCPSCSVLAVSTLQKLLKTPPVQILNMGTSPSRTRTWPTHTQRSNQPLLTLLWLVQVPPRHSHTSPGHQLPPLCASLGGQDRPQVGLSLY